MIDNRRKDTAHMKLWKEFKEFAFKGNVIDLARWCYHW